MSSPPEPRRPLSVLERSCWHVHQAVCHHLVTVAELHGPLRPEALRGALDRLQEQTPMLRVRIRRRRGRLFFCGERVPPVPLEVRAVPEEEARWTAAESELNRPLAADAGPLARCVLLRHAAERSTILLTTLHAASDGRSAFLLVRDLAGLLAGRDIPRPAVAGGRSFPSLHAALPPEVKGARGMLRLARMTGRQMVDRVRAGGAPRGLALDSRPPHFLRWTRILPVRLTRRETERLAGRARRERTSVHSALCAAGLLAVHRVMTDGRPRVLACTSAVDMRARVRAPVEEQVGLFASALWVAQRVGPRQPFWDLARQVRGKLGEKIRRGDPAVMAARGALTLPFMERLPGGNPSRRIARTAERMMYNFKGTGVSMVGNLEMADPGGPLSVASLSFAGTLANLGYFLAVADTFNGRLHVNYLVNDPLITRARGLRLVGEAAGFLHGAMD